MKINDLFLIILIIVLFGAVHILAPEPVYAGAQFQSSFQTATPNTQGQIIYTVREGDTCIRIELLTGVTVDRIIALNELDDECTLFTAQELILATVDPATATPAGPVLTATPGPPTPTPFEGNAEVCVVLFEDLDGNQMRSESEFYLAGGVISISNRIGTYSETRETMGGDPDLVDPVCFEEVPEGEYNLSMAIPEGYNATTSLNYALTVNAGDRIVVDFAAQPGSQLVSTEIQPEGGGRSPLLLAIGLFLLLGGAGLAFFFIRSRIKS